MTTLLENLTNATKELKAEYLKETSNYCETLFNQALKDSKKSVEELKGDFIFEEDERVIIEKASKKSNEACAVVFYGLDALVTKELKSAVKHFENSLVKLEARIIKKGLNLEGLNFEYGYVDQNFNCLITDVNGKTVKAQTILAWGEIQKPHYRYLVK